MKRTDYCGALRERDAGRQATICGWVQTRRDMGGVLFLDVRDREGILQVVFDASRVTPLEFDLAARVRCESVIAVRGTVALRDEETRNPALATGTIELRAEACELLSESAPLPFSPDGDTVRDDLRLKHRYLDLRRPDMTRNLRFRAAVARAVSDYLEQDGFVAVETPILTKSTPEGARDYLVPSRVHPGTFYALPQSPQIFKQLLMVGGFDKYYQIARCFRDEDLRADRQPEFTQVDMELSFVDQEDVLAHLERLFCSVFEQTMGITLPRPLPRMTWNDAMLRYGTDKPDLRFDMPIIDLTDLAAACDFSLFSRTAKSGGAVRALCVNGGALRFSRTDIEDLTRVCVSHGAGGMAWIGLRADGSLNTILTKYFTDCQMRELLARCGAEPGDFVLFCADSEPAVCRVLGNVRLHLADLLSLRREGDFQLLFVTDFPAFEYSPEEGRYMAAHHPFTMPHPDDLPYLTTDPARCRSLAYDAVLNGVELGSGSIRIHRADIQARMFEALGFSAEQTDQRFGFLLEAFRYGTPPHGGFAFGLDRLVMLMLGASSLREVIAFPKTRDAYCPLTCAPDTVDGAQLAALRLGSAPSAPVPVRKRAHTFDLTALSALSKLSLPEEERAETQAQLASMLDFADALSTLDTDGVEPTALVIPLENVLRGDLPAPCTPRDDLLAGAPAKRDGMFFVPQTVGTEVHDA